MSKDPAFLFYPQKWIEGTAEFSPAEKGVYIDLLSHQHQKGSLPNDIKKLSRLAGLSENEFLPIWENVKEKFNKTKDNRLANQTLNQISTKRLTKSYTKQLTSRFAVLIRNAQRNGIPNGQPLGQPNILEQIKKEFNINDFQPFSTEMETKIATKRLTEWFEIRLKSILFINNSNNNNNNKENIIDNNSSINNNIIISNNLKSEKKIFNTKPTCADFGELPNQYILASKEAIFNCKNQFKIEEKRIISLWEVFKIQNLTGENWYANEGKVYGHFINWIKIQNFENGNKNNNESDKSVGSSSRKKIEALKAYGSH